MRYFAKGSIILCGLILLAACSGTGEQNQPGTLEIDTIEVRGDFASGHLCRQGFDLSWLDVQAAANTPVLDADLEMNLLGEGGAQDLILAHFDPQETFCGVETSDDVRERLLRVDELVADGKINEARSRLEDLIRQLRDGYSASLSNHLLAKTAIRSVAQVGDRVRDLTDAAARAQQHGFDDLADEAIESARDAFRESAVGRIDAAASVDAVLTIAAQAQLLDLDDIASRAIEKARQIAAADLVAETERLDPCSATQHQINELLSAAALAQALAVRGSLVDAAIAKAESAQQILQVKENGGRPDGCGGQAVSFSETFSEGLVFINGTAQTCDGRNWHIEIEVSGAPAGVQLSSSGELDFTFSGGTSGPQIIPTNGTADFEGDVVSFQDPLTFEIALRDDNTAFIQIGSTGTGTIESPAGSLPFVSFPGGGFSAELGPAECGR